MSNKVHCLYTDTVDSLLYAGGTFKLADGLEVNSIAAWDGMNWIDLDGGQRTCPSACKGVASIIRFKDKIYAGGIFDSIGGINANGIASWDGQSWSPLGQGLKDSLVSSGSAHGMVVLNNELYISGSFDSAGGLYSPNVAKWY